MKTEDKMGALESEHLLTKTRNRMPVPFFSSLYFFSDSKPKNVRKSQEETLREMPVES